MLRHPRLCAWWPAISTQRRDSGRLIQRPSPTRRVRHRWMAADEARPLDVPLAAPFANQPPLSAARSSRQPYLETQCMSLQPRPALHRGEWPRGAQGAQVLRQRHGGAAPEAGDLDELESLQVKVSGAVLRRLRALRELELSMVPPRPSACSILVEIAGLKCLTKLTICHFSIRYARHHL
jgi:hypothetical protein